MSKGMRNNKGFSLVELLVVLIIIGVLAAVATPLYMQHTKRAKAAEAIATMGLIRQGLRDYRVSHNTYFSIKENTSDGNISQPLPQTVTAGTPDPVTAGLEIEKEVRQFFSNHCFYVIEGAKASTKSAPFKNPTTPVDFLIVANGASSTDCASDSTNCAIHAGEVKDYYLEMDNSGRIFVSYDAGKTWGAY